MRRQVVDARPAQVDVGCYGGDDFALAITVTDDAGAPVDLSTSLIAARVAVAPGAAPVASFSVAIGGDGWNVITLSLAAATTATLAGPYVWDCQWTDPAGAVLTLVAGSFKVTEDVTT